MRPAIVRGAAIELAGLCVGYALATCCLGVRLFWIVALDGRDILSTVQLGWLASGEAVGIGIGVLGTSWLVGRVNVRSCAVAAATIVVIANIVAMSLAPGPLVAARLASGLGTGSLVSVVTRIAARRNDAQHALALMQATAVFLLSGLYFLAPGLLAQFGAAGLFAALVVLSGMALICAFVCLRGDFPMSNVRSSPPAALRLGGLLGCAAIALMFTGQSTIGTYLVQFGNVAGLTAGGVANILAIALPLSMVGPLAARVLGDRNGLLIPLLAGLALLAADLFFIPRAATYIFFFLATGLLLLLTEFCAPYAIALISQIDRSGRFASAAPACIVAGVALGPGIGGQLVAAGQFEVLSLLAASLVVAGLGLFIVATQLGHAEAQSEIMGTRLEGRDSS